MYNVMYNVCAVCAFVYLLRRGWSTGGENNANAVLLIKAEVGLKVTGQVGRDNSKSSSRHRHESGALGVETLADPRWSQGSGAVSHGSRSWLLEKRSTLRTPTSVLLNNRSSDSKKAQPSSVTNYIHSSPRRLFYWSVSSFLSTFRSSNQGKWDVSFFAATVSREASVASVLWCVALGRGGGGKSRREWEKEGKTGNEVKSKGWK